jgi:acyl transferase domain-containing protein/acyl carrier protein
MPNPKSNEPFEGVAIIGMDGRFPGARNLMEFWRNLRDGIESISFFTPEELECASVDRGRWNRPDFVRAGGVLEGIEDFDASFFGFNPRDAELLDPQQRIFLECAWHALEDAGYNPDSYPGSIGVYAGSVLSSYLFNVLSPQELHAPLENFQAFTGNDKDHLSTRTSYKLNLKGPSVTVQTACSTSLVAVSMACQSLLDHQCDMALAGGVAIRVPQGTGYLHQPGMIFSSDGHCRPFDAKADGTLFSNGAGIVVLKRLRDAVADGDRIRAIIRGSSINNDGSLKVGYTAPSQDGQAEVIATAQAIAGVHPETISYIETHGTGTNLGDPIEIAALTQVFRASTDRKQFCAIGSLKSNIGHMDAAAGVAGLIKTVLALENKQLPPSLNFEHPNPAIDLANSPFYVNTSLKEWKSPGTPRRAGVSSFGIGGTNAHVVLEEAFPEEASSDSRATQILSLSAKSNRALDDATTNLAMYLRQHPESHLADVAYTLQTGRKTFSHRRAIVCHTSEDAVTALEDLDPVHVIEASRAPGESSIAFMFPGQGTQRVHMGLDLYRNERVFREQVDFCCERLLPYLNFDLRDALFPAAVTTEAETRLDQTKVAQPALFVIEYSLARLLMHWGIRPSAMIGHSVGEYVAACLAGVFSLEDALKLLAARGRLMQELLGGSMLAVPLFEDDAIGWVSEEIQLAAANAPSSCVLSGPASAIADLQARLASQGVESQILRTSHAFHSAMMEPMLAPFRKILEGITLRPPTIPFVSNVSGTWITASQATDPAYWARHLRGTVRFASGIRNLLETPNRILLEVGPGSTLKGLASQQSESSADHIFLASLPGTARQEKDAGALLKAVATMWTQGVQIDWPAFYADERRRRLPLPTYPFERQRYWIERRSAAEPAAAATKESSDVRDIADWFYVPVWKQDPWPQVHHLDAPRAPTSWLMFADEGHLASHLAARLREADHSVTRVVAGAKFVRKAEGDYLINPRCDEDYIALLRNLREEGRFPQRIAHLWDVHPVCSQTSGGKSSEESHLLGFYSLLSLARALGEQAGKAHVRMDVLSSGLHSITGEEAFCPEKALVLGPCLVIPQEFDRLSCRNIDLPDQLASGAIQGSLLDSLVSELTSDHSSMIAYRGGRRWSRCFERVRIDRPRSEQVRLRDAGTYMILGGLGGLGLHLARYLAHAAKKARLVLIARSEIRPKAEWPAWPDAHPQNDDPASAKIRAIEELEQLGAEVLILSADVTNIFEMRDAVRTAEQRFGPIHGVVHAAGIAGDGIIQFGTAESAARVLAPKVKGTIVLDALLKDADLDFLIMCSSVSSILGGIGQADYSAANAFMDSYAQGRSSHGGYPVISVNWDAWRDVGMAANGRQPTTAMNVNQSQPNSGMTALEGSDAFARILSIAGVPQIAVSTVDLNSRIFRRGSLAEPLRAAAASGESAPPVGQPVASPRPAPERRTPYVAPRNAVEQRIAEVWEKLLGIKGISINDNFFELGGHSLLGTQLISSLRSAFAVELPMRSLFDVPTVEAMAQRIQTIHWALREPETAAEGQGAEREEGVL